MDPWKRRHLIHLRQRDRLGLDTGHVWCGCDPETVPQERRRDHQDLGVTCQACLDAAGLGS